MKLCHHCGNAWVSERRLPGRTETCATCGYDLRCCLNCKFYSPGKPNDCISPTVEPVLDKEKSCFCDEFVFAEDRASGKDDSSRQKSKYAWDSLFGNE